jgi:ABC-type sugar transport system permease subunit
MFQSARRRLILPFLLPQTLLYTTFTFVPIVATVALALTNWTSANPIRFIGLGNFRLILKDPVFRGSIGNSIYYIVAGGVLLFAPACLLAWCLSQAVRAKGLFRFFILAPAVISVSVAGLMWKWLYNPLAGLVGVPIRTIGLALGIAPLVSGLLRDPSTSLTAVILTDLWHSMGIWVILLMAGLERIPSEFSEAARVDGANEGQAFFLVTLPLLWEHLRILIVLWMLTAVQAFAFNIIMRSHDVIATYIYSMTFDRFDWAYGMALATMVMPCIFVIVVLANRLRQREAVEY